MASDLLHIKDTYYFDVPKALFRSRKDSIDDFQDWFVRLDPDYQNWEADRVVNGLSLIGLKRTDFEGLIDTWKHWQHEREQNHGWPLWAFIESRVDEIAKKAERWASKQDTRPREPVIAYLAEHPEEEYAWATKLEYDPATKSAWESWKRGNTSHLAMQDFRFSAKWSPEKVEAYNRSLDGKIFIPQPFGTLKNAYEPASGFCISKFMIIEVVVALLCLLIFGWLAKKVASGKAPKGKSWNFLEGLLQFVRNQVLVPAMGEHDADDFLPFFWTVFVFIFGCNLMGMIPWVGSPTASIGMTGAMAFIIFVIGVTLGIREFGVLGYLKNIVPSLGLPMALGVLIIPMLWVIEFASLLIKHVILAMRLVANMVAGHAVLLGVMGLAIGIKGLTMGPTQWWSVASISILSTTVLSVLELFVAFLQAAIFTFLSALFISSARHHH